MAISERLKNFFNSFGLVFLGIASFMFFLYFTFPFVVLKESLTNSINKNYAINLRIGELEADLPLGFEAKNVVLTMDDGGNPLRIKSANIQLSIWRLIIGEVGINAELSSANDGTMNLFLAIGIFDLISGSPLPKSIELAADKFEVGGLFDFALSSAGSSAGMNPLLADLFTQVSMTGLLSGVADLTINAGAPTRSKGELELKLSNGSLIVADPTLNIEEQRFEKFIVKANMVQGNFAIDKISGIKTQELQLDFDGTINLNQELAKSQVNLNLSVKLDKTLKENFGFAVDLAMGGKDGQGRMQIVGPMADPKIIKL